MPKYAILIDGRERRRVVSGDELRAWLVGYRDGAENDDDPDATHVQVLELSTLSWLTGGKLVPREQFL